MEKRKSILKIWTEETKKPSAFYFLKNVSAQILKLNSLKKMKFWQMTQKTQNLSLIYIETLNIGKEESFLCVLSKIP